MIKKQDYTRDIAQIRSMMERSSKFGSLSGWAGILAGLYALAGAAIAYYYLDFHPGRIVSTNSGPGSISSHLTSVIALAIIVLAMAVVTAVFFSWKKTREKGETIWNAVSRQLLIHMAVPLCTGGVLLLILCAKGLTGLLAPMTLLFYGLALYSASKFTLTEIKVLGVIEIVLGLLSAWFTEYSLLLWALGFGVVHIIYGIYMHFKYER